MYTTSTCNFENQTKPSNKCNNRFMSLQLKIEWLEIVFMWPFAVLFWNKCWDREKWMRNEKKTHGWLQINVYFSKGDYVIVCVWVCLLERSSCRSTTSFLISCRDLICSYSFFFICVQVREKGIFLVYLWCKRWLNIGPVSICGALLPVRIYSSE